MKTNSAFSILNSALIRGSALIDFPGIGDVAVTVRRNARSMRLRWKGPMLSLTVPYGQPYREALAFLHGASEFIESHRNAPLYNIGQRIQAPEITIDIKQSDTISQTIRTIFPAPMQACVYVASDVDITSAPAIKSIDGILRRIAFRFAPDILLPQAHDVSDRLDVRPAAWKISRGHCTLGLCSGKGVIRLSSLLVFYPAELRRYVICHELAHLTHMNHSQAFHALCDQYYGGNSAKARADLRAIKPPLIR